MQSTCMDTILLSLSPWNWVLYLPLSGCQMISTQKYFLMVNRENLIEANRFERLGRIYILCSQSITVSYQYSLITCLWGEGGVGALLVMSVVYTPLTQANNLTCPLIASHRYSQLGRSMCLHQG